MFMELREYHTKPGQRDRWVKYMEEVIIPFQVSKGMVIAGSFIGRDDDDTYIWTRRFESEEERDRLYDAVYQSDTWKNEINDKVGSMIDRDKTIVTRIEPTPKSVIR